MRVLVTLFVVSVFSVTATEASASEVIVRDCAGGILAHQPVDLGEKVALEVELGRAIERMPASLVSLDAHVSITGMIKGGDVLRFEELVAGQWRFCGIQGEDVAFTQIEIQVAEAQAGGALAKYVALAGAVLAPVAFIGSEASGGGGNNEGLLGPGSAVSSVGVAPADALEDEEPEFLDEDFEFGAQAAPLSPAS